jgi:hypothetical protein
MRDGNTRPTEFSADAFMQSRAALPILSTCPRYGGSARTSAVRFSAPARSASHGEGRVTAWQAHPRCRDDEMERRLREQKPVPCKADREVAAAVVCVSAGREAARASSREAPRLL